MFSDSDLFIRENICFLIVFFLYFTIRRTNLKYSNSKNKLKYKNLQSLGQFQFMHLFKET